MTQSELKELKTIGAELGTAKAENEKLRGLLREAVHCCPDEQLRNEMKAALSQQTEPAPTVNALAFVQPVPDHCDRIVWRERYYHLPLDTESEIGQAQDEREAFEVACMVAGLVRPGNYSPDFDRYVSERVQGRYEGFKLGRVSCKRT